MINLLSPAQKDDIRAARLNVQLRKYSLLSFFVAIGVLAIYGVGFYLVTNEKDAALRQLNHDEAIASQYQAVQNDAKVYKTNLATASKVLSSGISYSQFLIKSAQALPAGSVLTDLSLSNIGGNSLVANGVKANQITLSARTNSYGNALQIKESLEASDLFENVSLTTISKTEPTAESEALEKNYPFTVAVNVVISQPKAVQ